MPPAFSGWSGCETCSCTNFPGLEGVLLWNTMQQTEAEKEQFGAAQSRLQHWRPGYREEEKRLRPNMEAEQTARREHL